MANVWLAKEGFEPTVGEEPFRTMPLAECITQLSLKHSDYLCDLDTLPHFGNHRPELVRGPSHVVVEITEREAQRQGWESGFYVSPLSVEQALVALRNVYHG